VEGDCKQLVEMKHFTRRGLLIVQKELMRAMHPLKPQMVEMIAFHQMNKLLSQREVLGSIHTEWHQLVEMITFHQRYVYSGIYVGMRNSEEQERLRLKDKHAGAFTWLKCSISPEKNLHSGMYVSRYTRRRHKGNTKMNWQDRFQDSKWGE
jgi:hypothetical protein